MTQPTNAPQDADNPPPTRRVRTDRAGRSAAAGLAVAGVVGLGLVALPGGAGAAPQLPPVSAEDLVSSVLTADRQAFGGTVELDNALGLPALPQAPQLADGDSTARIWTDGQDRGRVQLPTDDGERTFVADGSTFWSWNSEDRSVTRKQLDPGAERPGPPTEADPATAAAEALAVLRPTSAVAVDGTAEVAGRAAYELVLTPAPTERTLLREVRVAVDAEHRMPLRLTVLAAGSDEPVLQLGFTDIDFSAQDPELFTFTPPPGARVEDGPAPDGPGGWHAGPGRPDAPEGATPDGSAPAGGPTVVGDGWDTVLVADRGAMAAGPGDNRGWRGADNRGWGGPDAEDAPEGSPENAPQAMPDLAGLGNPVSGPWGSGTLISTAVASAIITDDGRIAAGAVPEQVLVEALSR